MRLSVVFVVDDKIKEQLRQLSNESVLEFILGRDDSNIFEAHMLAIEELDEYCECILKEFARYDISGLSLIHI